MIDVANSKKLR